MRGPFAVPELAGRPWRQRFSSDLSDSDRAARLGVVEERPPGQLVAGEAPG